MVRHVSSYFMFLSLHVHHLATPASHRTTPAQVASIIGDIQSYHGGAVASSSSSSVRDASTEAISGMKSRSSSSSQATGVPKRRRESLPHSEPTKKSRIVGPPKVQNSGGGSRAGSSKQSGGAGPSRGRGRTAGQFGQVRHHVHCCLVTRLICSSARSKVRSPGDC